MRRKHGESFKPGSSEDLLNRFVYHAPGKEHRKLHDAVRQRVMLFASELFDALPPGRETALVLTHLELVSFWAHAAIARQELPDA